jgi:hypothetical protein
MGPATAVASTSLTEVEATDHTLLVAVLPVAVAVAVITAVTVTVTVVVAVAVAVTVTVTTAVTVTMTTAVTVTMTTAVTMEATSEGLRNQHFYSLSIFPGTLPGERKCASLRNDRQVAGKQIIVSGYCDFDAGQLRLER